MEKYPPSREQVLIQYYGYIKKIQATTTGTSSRKQAIILVVEDIKRWWDRTGIKTKSNCTIIESVNTLLDSYRLLQKSKNR